LERAYGASLEPDLQCYNKAGGPTVLAEMDQECEPPAFFELSMNIH
jgi:hypothetical protein